MRAEVRLGPSTQELQQLWVLHRVEAVCGAARGGGIRTPSSGPGPRQALSEEGR